MPVPFLTAPVLMAMTTYYLFGSCVCISGGIEFLQENQITITVLLVTISDFNKHSATLSSSSDDDVIIFSWSVLLFKKKEVVHGGEHKAVWMKYLP